MRFRKCQQSIFICLAVSLLLMECKPKEPTITCRSFEGIVSQNGCYAPNEGLTLTAVGHQVSSEPRQFVWAIYPQGDSVHTNLAGVEQILVGTEQITIPDSLLRNSPLFAVKVETTCENGSLESMYYPFIRRTHPGTACTIWVLKEDK